MQRTGIHEITFTARCESGLHIGGSQDELTIGGSDNPVIKNPANNKPYIPGSSLKGKMRHELEKGLGKQGLSRREREQGTQGSLPCNCAQDDCPVCRVFGAHMDTSGRLGPSRIIVRDGHPSSDNPSQVETKSETAISRQSGSALGGSLRTSERVVEGSIFSMHIVLQVFDNDANFSYNGHQGSDALQAVVARCLRLVEMMGLGGGTSRGSGAVSFHNFTMDGEAWTHWSG